MQFGVCSDFEEIALKGLGISLCLYYMFFFCHNTKLTIYGETRICQRLVRGRQLTMIHQAIFQIIANTQIFIR